MIFSLWLVAVVSANEKVELQTSSTNIAHVVDTTDMPDSLIVYQEVNKLDDIARDENPIVVNEEELASKNEDLELNEISNNLGDDDIVDVIHNFIADKDPMLQVIS